MPRARRQRGSRTRPGEMRGCEGADPSQGRRGVGLWGFEHALEQPQGNMDPSRGRRGRGPLLRALALDGESSAQKSAAMDGRMVRLVPGRSVHNLDLPRSWRRACLRLRSLEAAQCPAPPASPCSADAASAGTRRSGAQRRRSGCPHLQVPPGGPGRGGRRAKRARTAGRCRSSCPLP